MRRVEVGHNAARSCVTVGRWLDCGDRRGLLENIAVTLLLNSSPLRDSALLEESNSSSLRFFD